VFNLTGADRTSGLGSTSYRIANATYDSGWRNGSGCFSLNGLMNGNYTLTYWSTDRVGNMEAPRSCALTLVRAADCPGDVTGDGACDIFDIVLVANCYPSTCNDVGWNPIVDFNDDSIINIYDLVTCASHYTG
jgi:hypothetical protein